MATIQRACFTAGAFFLILLAGCAAKQTSSLLRDRPQELAPASRLAGVPFFPQRQYQCGPAALAMALGWAGANATPEELAPQIYIPRKKGSLQVEMLAAARRHGMLSLVLEPRLSDVLQEIDAGHPVIVFQNLGLSWYPVWHYAVVIGYGLDDGKIILHSGEELEHTVLLSTFERTWVRGGAWAMLVLPPDRLPKTAGEDRYLRAALALEQTGQLRAAAQAYETALTRWPGSLAAQMGRGNSYYALGDLQNAGQAFLQATRDHPEAGAAFNNLAQTYADQKRYREALDAAQKAVDLDPASAIFRETLDEVRALIGSASTPK